MEKVSMMESGDALRRADDGAWGKTPVAKTADYTVIPDDVGKIFTNAGAAGAVIFTLPTPKPGMWFTFIKAVVGQNLVIQAPASVTINNGTAAQVYKNTTSEMGTATLVGISATQYAVQAEKGTWANAAS